LRFRQKADLRGGFALAFDLGCGVLAARHADSSLVHGPGEQAAQHFAVSVRRFGGDAFLAAVEGRLQFAEFFFGELVRGGPEGLPDQFLAHVILRVIRVTAFLETCHIELLLGPPTP